MYTTQAPSEMFRMGRTHSALQAIHEAIDKFIDYAGRDWYTAIEFGLCEVAERLAYDRGNIPAGRQFGERKFKALEAWRTRKPRKPRQGRRAEPAAPANVTNFELVESSQA